MIRLEPLRPPAWLFRAMADDAGEMGEFHLSGVIEGDGDCALIKGVEGKVLTRQFCNDLVTAVRGLGFSRLRYFRRGRRTGPGRMTSITPFGRWFELTLTETDDVGRD